MNVREIKEMVIDHGLEFVSIKGGKHWKVVVRNEWGRESMVIFPRTMSDNYRGWRNKAAQLRQIMRGA